MTIMRHTLVRSIQKFIHHARNPGNCDDPIKLRNRHLAYCLVFAPLSACATTPNAAASGRDPVRRDVEGYAIASCLTYQQQPYLKDQGDGWASAIIQRSRGDLDALTAVAEAVKTEVAKGNMSVIRVETGPKHEKALPIAYCFLILDTPSVHTAVENTIKKLAASYKK